MEPEAHKKIFLEEGFRHIFEWRGAPNTQYEEHAHQEKVSIYIMDGEVSFVFEDGTRKDVKQGERFNVPPKKKHTARVGEKGCYYLVAEMIKGDS